jgi:hypothetical protein
MRTVSVLLVFAMMLSILPLPGPAAAQTTGEDVGTDFGAKHYPVQWRIRGVPDQTTVTMDTYHEVLRFSGAVDGSHFGPVGTYEEFALGFDIVSFDAASSWIGVNFGLTTGDSHFTDANSYLLYFNNDSVILLSDGAANYVAPNDAAQRWLPFALSAITEPLHVRLIYRGETLEVYYKLRSEPDALLETPRAVYSGLSRASGYINFTTSGNDQIQGHFSIDNVKVFRDPDADIGANPPEILKHREGYLVVTVHQPFDLNRVEIYNLRDERVPASELTWSVSHPSLTIHDGKLVAEEKGVFPLTVSLGTATLTLQVVAKADTGPSAPVFAPLGENVMPISGWVSPPPANALGSNPDFITDEHYQRIKEAGFNVIHGLYERMDFNPSAVLQALDAAYANGLKYMVSDVAIRSSAGDPVQMMNTMKRYMDHPAYIGNTVIDEPSAAQFDDLGAARQTFELLAPDKYFYINLLPTYASVNQLFIDKSDPGGGMPTMAQYEQYLDEYISKVNPKFLSYDYYPLEGTFPALKSGYFENMSVIREKAARHGIPFWTFIQTASWGPNIRVPVKAEIWWQVNTSLAYGAKGIQYFTYWEPLEPEFDGGLVSRTGQVTPIYDDVRQMNLHIAAIDHVLMNAESLGVLVFGASPVPVPAADQVASCGELDSLSGDVPLLAGCFDYNGSTALYVVNNSIQQSGTATLRFSEQVEAAAYQMSVRSVLTAEEFTFRLEAGEGVLVVVDEPLPATGKAVKTNFGSMHDPSEWRWKSEPDGTALTMANGMLQFDGAVDGTYFGPVDPYHEFALGFEIVSFEADSSWIGVAFGLSGSQSLYTDPASYLFFFNNDSLFLMSGGAANNIAPDDPGQRWLPFALSSITEPLQVKLVYKDGTLKVYYKFRSDPAEALDTPRAVFSRLDDKSGYLSFTTSGNPSIQGKFRLDNVQIYPDPDAQFEMREIVPPLTGIDVSTDFGANHAPGQWYSIGKPTADRVIIQNGVLQFDHAQDGSVFGPKGTYREFAVGFDIVSFAEDSTWIGFAFGLPEPDASFTAPGSYLLFFNNDSLFLMSDGATAVVPWDDPAQRWLPFALSEIRQPLNVKLVYKDGTLKVYYKLDSEGEQALAAPRAVFSNLPADITGYMHFTTTGTNAGQGTFSLDNIRVNTDPDAGLAPTNPGGPPPAGPTTPPADPPPVSPNPLNPAPLSPSTPSPADDGSAAGSESASPGTVLEADFSDAISWTSDWRFNSTPNAEALRIEDGVLVFAGARDNTAFGPKVKFGGFALEFDIVSFEEGSSWIGIAFGLADLDASFTDPGSYLLFFNNDSVFLMRNGASEPVEWADPVQRWLPFELSKNQEPLNVRTVYSDGKLEVYYKLQSEPDDALLKPRAVFHGLPDTEGYVHFTTTGNDEIQGWFRLDNIRIADHLPALTRKRDDAAEEAESTGEFTDVAGHPQEGAIRKAASLGVVFGYPDGSFRPDKPVTRAELLTMLARLQGISDEAGETVLPFADSGDVPAWARQAVAAAVRQGIVAGYGDGSIRANREMTRGEFMVVLARALGLAAARSKPVKFKDRDEIAAWALPSIVALIEAGWIEEDEKLSFHPHAPVTRGEAVAILMKTV